MREDSSGASEFSQFGQLGPFFKKLEFQFGCVSSRGYTLGVVINICTCQRALNRWTPHSSLSMVVQAGALLIRTAFETADRNANLSNVIPQALRQHLHAALG